MILFSAFTVSELSSNEVQVLPEGKKMVELYSKHSKDGKTLGKEYIIVFKLALAGSKKNF